MAQMLWKLLFPNLQVSELFVTVLILQAYFFLWAKDPDPSWEAVLRCFCSFQRAVNLTEVYRDEIKVAAHIGEKSDFGCQAKKVAEKNSQEKF